MTIRSGATLLEDAFREFYRALKKTKLAITKFEAEERAALEERHVMEAAYLDFIEYNDRKLEMIRSGKADAEMLRANIQALLGRTPQEPKEA